MASRPICVATLALGTLTLGLTACGGGGDEGAGGEVSTVEGVSTRTDREEGGPEQIPRPPAGKAAIGGTFSILGRPARGYEVSLGKKGKAPLFASAMTDRRGRFLFRAIRPGSYYVDAVFSLKRKEIPTRARVRCSMQGFEVSWGPVPIPGKPGQFSGFLVSARSRDFRAKVGDRITKDMVFTLKARGRITENVLFTCG